MEGVAAASAVIGIVVAALHGARVLYEDFEKVVHVDKTLLPIRNDLKALVDVLSSLSVFVNDENTPQVALLVLKQNSVELASDNCQKVCTAFQAKLDEWTKHSNDGKISWRDKIKPGFFGEAEIHEFRTQLLASKGTFMIGLQMATISLSVGSSAKADEMLQALNTIKEELRHINGTTTRQIADIHEQPRHVQVVPGTDDKSSQEILALFKESIAKANTHIEDFLYQIETGKVKEGNKSKALIGWFGSNEKGDKVKIKTGDVTVGDESRLVIGRGGEVNMEDLLK
ncbi:hypothetical protein BDZ45DRAFT_731398 [Acephala macrosclerotiorum]|nr:hypothetical protein BDZ45DRAFT_731398 [Acephala macrosclerotiorum]